MKGLLPLDMESLSVEDAEMLEEIENKLLSNLELEILSD
jgi:hypothetical protein